MKKFLKILFIIFLVIIVAVVIFFLLPARTPQFKNPDGSIVANSIASIEEISLGGWKQTILIRGRDKAKPLILFLHGGPGMPMMYLAYKFQRELENHFLVIHWDQRGAGKSYSKDIPVKTLNVEQILSDAYELINYLRERFHKEKIYLVGHSWGSYLGIITASRHPELFYAYVGIGQVVDESKSGTIQDEFIKKKAIETGNKEALADLQRYGAGAREKWLFEFGGELYGETSWMPFLTAGLFSPEYTATDVLNVGKGSSFSSKHMKYNALQGTVIDNIKELNLPVYFFTGRYDYTTPFQLIQRYYQKIQAPLKRMIWFEKSAHFPFYEEPEKFTKEMLNTVLKETIIGITLK